MQCHVISFRVWSIDGLEWWVSNEQERERGALPGYFSNLMNGYVMFRHIHKQREWLVGRSIDSADFTDVYSDLSCVLACIL